MRSAGAPLGTRASSDQPSVHGAQWRSGAALSGARCRWSALRGAPARGACVPTPPNRRISPTLGRSGGAARRGAASSCQTAKCGVAPAPSVPAVRVAARAAQRPPRRARCARRAQHPSMRPTGSPHRARKALPLPARLSLPAPRAQACTGPGGRRARAGGRSAPSRHHGDRRGRGWGRGAGQGRVGGCAADARRRAWQAAATALTPLGL